MAPRSLPLLAALVGLAAAQTPDPASQDAHPRLSTWKCTVAGGCVVQDTAVVLDSLSHPIAPAGCATLDGSVCPDAETCQRNCVVSGIADYAAYGVTTDGGALHLDMLHDDGSSASPRVYLLSPDGARYEMLQLTGGELSFDVDVSKLPCGMNGALYLSEMEADGGQAVEAANKAGAPYGTGYCDAQCFTNPAFVNGVPNLDGVGACCNEMDIWEANAEATQLAPHTCNTTGLYGCTSAAECGAQGVCDKNGCGQNPYALGSPAFYGPGLTLDTRRPFTVVTQFPSAGGAGTGALASIRRLYVQDGRVLEHAGSSVTDDFCSAHGAAKFLEQGALGGMGDALARGMVLIFSVWWDTSGYMNWLDAGAAGPCDAEEGNPDVIVTKEPRPDVTFSNIRWGEIGSTFTAGNSTTNSTVPAARFRGSRVRRA